MLVVTTGASATEIVIATNAIIPSHSGKEPQFRDPQFTEGHSRAATAAATDVATIMTRVEISAFERWPDPSESEPNDKRQKEK